MGWRGRAAPAADTPARSRHAMAALDGQLLMCGGEDANGDPLAETSNGDGTSWAALRLTMPPPKRVGAEMVAVP